MQQALIVSSYGRQFIIEIEGKLYEAVTKGKKTEFVVGDIVLATVSNSVQAQIQQLVSRRNLLYRSDLNRSKIIASNLDQLLIVVAVKPNFNLSFLNSCLICAEAEKITPIIIVNKMDLPESALFAEKLANLYQDKLNYQLIKLTAYDDCQTLQPLLQGKQSLLIGQSGMGKSTITNQIYPPAQTKTATITKQETSGRHTTTNATLYHLNFESNLIDCPGLQEFGLYHLEISQVANYFPELHPYLGKCKFSNCIHINEPNCAIKTNLAEIDSSRYEYYVRLVTSLQRKNKY